MGVGRLATDSGDALAAMGDVSVRIGNDVRFPADLKAQTEFSAVGVGRMRLYLELRCTPQSRTLSSAAGDFGLGCLEATPLHWPNRYASCVRFGDCALDDT